MSIRNEAMFPPSCDDLNVFTEKVKARYLDGALVMVKLRDGQWREISYRAEDEDGITCSSFESKDFGWWYADGSSPTSNDFDMVEMN